MSPGVFHLCPGLHAAAKVAIFRVLRKIASLTIFRVSCDLSQFFVMLIISEVQSELSIFQNLRKLRKIVSLTIFCVTCDFWKFFVTLIITKPDRVADLTKFAKIAKNRKLDYFSRYLRFLTVLCHVNVHFSRVHDNLKKAVC